MPETETVKIIKQITVGTETRDIGAKYDDAKNAIQTTYRKTSESYSKNDADSTFATKTALETLEATVNSDCVKTTGLDGTLRTFFTNNPDFTVPAAVNKTIEFVTDSSISLSNPEESPYQIVKVVVCDSEQIGDTEKVIVKLDETESTALARSYIEKGAIYEIYKKILIGKNKDGDTTVYTSSYNSWGDFSLRILTNGEPSNKQVTFMIYKEGWEENNPGGAQ